MSNPPLQSQSALSTSRISQAHTPMYQQSPVTAHTIPQNSPQSMPNQVAQPQQQIPPPLCNTYNRQPPKCFLNSNSNSNSNSNNSSNKTRAAIQNEATDLPTADAKKQQENMSRQPSPMNSAGHNTQQNTPITQNAKHLKIIQNCNQCKWNCFFCFV